VFLTIIYIGLLAAREMFKKNSMKKILVVLALSCLFTNINVVNAQTVRQSAIDPTRVDGHFDVIKMTSKGEEHINVNYCLFPAPFFDVVKINLNTPDPMPMSIKIVSANGQTKFAWKPEQVSYRYDQQFNIQSLAPGLYHMDIYDANNNKMYSVPFSKEASTANPAAVQTRDRN